MRRVQFIGGLIALLGAAVLAGCGGGGSSPGGVTAGLRGVYTVNGGGGFNVDGTASFINTGQGNVVTARAFDVGKAPNWMVIHANQGYIVNSVSNNIQVVDLTTGSTVGVVSTGAGSNPMKLAVGPDGLAYVTNLMTNSVAVIDLSTRALVRTIDVSAAGSGPTGIAIAGGKVYVTLTNLVIDGMNVSYGQGKVAVIPVGGAAVTSTINVGTNPQDAVVDGAGRVHVACTGNYGDVPGSISLIDPATDSVTGTVSLGGAPGNLTVAGGRVFAADGSLGVMVYDAASGAILKGPGSALTTTGASILDVRYDPQSQLVYAADFSGDRVLVIDPVQLQVTTTLAVGDGPTAIGVAAP